MLQLSHRSSQKYDALHVCVPAVNPEEVFKIYHEGMAGGHRGMAGTLDKIQRTFCAMSAHEKICRLVDQCYTCLAKERSIQAKRGPHVSSSVGNVGENEFIDLVSMSETVRKNRYLLTVQDGFTRLASAYPICNEEALWLEYKYMNISVFLDCLTKSTPTKELNLKTSYGLNYLVN